MDVQFLLEIIPSQLTQPCFVLLASKEENIAWPLETYWCFVDLLRLDIHNGPKAAPA